MFFEPLIKKRLADFYALLGCEFDYHKHGNSPLHYSAKINNTMLEIYPLQKEQVQADRHLRLGLALDSFDKVIEKLKEKQAKFISEPDDTEFGFMAVVEDPDERKIELYKK